MLKEGRGADICRSSNPVLHDISLRIEPGQRVAICGRTGRQVNLPSRLTKPNNSQWQEFSCSLTPPDVIPRQRDHHHRRNRLIHAPSRTYPIAYRRPPPRTIHIRRHHPSEPRSQQHLRRRGHYRGPWKSPAMGEDRVQGRAGRHHAQQVSVAGRNTAVGVCEDHVAKE